MKLQFLKLVVLRDLWSNLKFKKTSLKGFIHFLESLRNKGLGYYFVLSGPRSNLWQEVDGPQVCEWQGGDPFGDLIFFWRQGNSER